MSNLSGANNTVRFHTLSILKYCPIIMIEFKAKNKISDLTKNLQVIISTNLQTQIAIIIEIKNLEMTIFLKKSIKIELTSNEEEIK